MNPPGQESARFDGMRAATSAAITPATGIAVMIPIRMKLSGILDTILLLLAREAVNGRSTWLPQFYFRRSDRSKRRKLSGFGTPDPISGRNGHSVARIYGPVIHLITYGYACQYLWHTCCS